MDHEMRGKLDFSTRVQVLRGLYHEVCSEVWFGIIDRRAIRRGVFTSVKDLNQKIRQFITGWNDRKHPFVWTKTAVEVLAKANPL